MGDGERLVIDLERAGPAVSEQVLIATLGSEPQVVTLALDMLRAKGYSIAAVKVVHTMGESF